MCGISGIINFNRDEPDYYLNIINKINIDLNHRGPDNSGIWKDKKKYCYLGHTRLSIIDLSHKANQPMTDSDNDYVISFNGEIYNYLELRDLLISHGVKFFTSSDTEVILNGFKYFGKNFLLNVDGMFVFAIYDVKKEKLFICRDRGGEKPLYYISTSRLFIFSSELKPLLRFYQKIKFNICKQSVFDYLTLRYVPKDSTLISEIKKLEPGNYLELSNNNELKICRYFSYNVTPEEHTPRKKLIDYGEKILFSLKTSIKRRLNSDVPLGTFLSGGIDSTITSAIISKEFNTNLKTFSIGFENYRNSEHHTADKISKQIGTTHNEIVVTNSEIRNVFEKIGDLMDEPNGDRSFIPMYIISKYAKEHVTVVLSGDGADELFGGYPRHWAFANKYNKEFNNYNKNQLVDLYFNEFLPVFKISKLKKFNSLMYNNFINKFTKYYFNSHRSIAASTRQLDFDSYMPCVLSKVDTMSMRCSLEVRTPFLSPEILSLSMIIPDELLFNGVYAKLILRNICRKYVSKDIALLPKTGFGLPLHSYEFFKSNTLRYINDSLQTLEKNNFFSSQPLLINFLKENCMQNSNSQWSLIILAKWLNSLKINL